MQTQANMIDEAWVVANLKPSHPRLLVTEDTWDRIASRRAEDRGLDALVSGMEADAAALLDLEPVRYEKIGRRLLAVSREALWRIMTLSLVYRLSGDRAYQQRAELEMHTVIAFEDWNPSHFLDVAEMAAAVAIGYDWLYDDLSPDFREAARAALWNKALRYPFDSKWRSETRWITATNNWNSVCYAGLTTAMLTVAEDHPPARVAEWLNLMRKNNPLVMSAYAPDGVYPEGSMYWSYGTTFQVMLIEALESALGDSFGLDEYPGFLVTGRYIPQMIGPTGRRFNFSDGRETNQPEPAMFWFAARTNDPGLARFQRDLDWRMGNKRLQPLGAIWWSRLDCAETDRIDLPLRWVGRGEQPLAVFRSSWAGPDALYLATKGGRATLSHAHMDAGSFVFDAGGVRWAADLGAQDYHDLETKGFRPLFALTQDSKRWTVFRLNNHSHSTLTINGKLHRADGQATMLDFSDDPASPSVTYDLTAVFSEDASRVTRRFDVESDSAVRITDDLEGLHPGARVRWAMMTPAQIESQGDVAVLARAGRTLEAKLIEPAGTVFEWMTADPPANDYDAPNPDHRMLIVNTIAPETGELKIVVRLRL